MNILNKHNFIDVTIVCSHCNSIYFQYLLLSKMIFFGQYIVLFMFTYLTAGYILNILSYLKIFYLYFLDQCISLSNCFSTFLLDTWLLFSYMEERQCWEIETGELESTVQRLAWVRLHGWQVVYMRKQRGTLSLVTIQRVSAFHISCAGADWRSKAVTP